LFFKNIDANKETIQRIENNESTPTGETIKRIANALDVQLSELSGSGIISETADIKAIIIFLKKQLSKTREKSEIKTFERFINTLTELKEKELSPKQLEAIESYLEYLELEKIPSFNNELFKKKLIQFKKYLKNKLRFLPSNYYRFWVLNFGVSFAIGFSLNGNIDNSLRIGVISTVVVLIGIAIIMDLRTKKQNRSLNSLRF